MAGLARRLAPAAVLGGLAVIIVGLLDPALAGRDAQAQAAPEPIAEPAVNRAQDAQPQRAQAQAQAEAPVQRAAPDPSSQQQEAPDQSTQQQSTDCSQGQQVAGGAASTPWGPVQVVATVAGGQLCEAHAVAWPNNDRKSQMINSYAIPALDSQMTQGATQIDFVSGATYTSNGYALSLQSILDQL